MSKWIFVLVLSLIFSFIPGCSNHIKFAKVEDITGCNKVSRGIHVVDNGESLYSIAFRYGRDFRKLAAINGIKYPYKILPGQKILLNRESYKSRKNHKTIRNYDTKQANTNKNIELKQTVNNTGWVWPTSGESISEFSNSNQFNKGIDISVNSSRHVQSVSDGTVVYRGTGLIGYGKLIIIKHDEEFLSAYAHNDKFLVNEGQWVKKGQHIAMIGDKMKTLHFEIRKNGKPVDPLLYLPKKLY
jgi:lipoprotein NlpD